MVVQLVWQSEPIALANATRDYGQRIIQGLHAIADLFAARIEAAMKQGAPWADRTGAARQGLRAFAEKSAAGVVLYAVTSVSYGVYLELGTSKMGARPIISPTLEQMYGPIMSALRALVGGR